MQTTSERAKRHRLLYVEDDRHLHGAMRRALVEYDLTIADTIGEARALIGAQRFDAWIIDVVVPDGSGLELLAWARGRQDLTPAVVVTGAVDRAPVNAAQALGAEFLYKPFNVGNLRAFLARALVPARTEVAREDLVHDLISVYQLSDREVVLVRCVARGVARAELPEALGVSDNTVKTHIRRILKKTGHKDIAHLYRDLASARR